jgi:membrane protease YdiL (CAAX protease family)
MLVSYFSNEIGQAMGREIFVSDQSIEESLDAQSIALLIGTLVSVVAGIIAPLIALHFISIPIKPFIGFSVRLRHSPVWMIVILGWLYLNGTITADTTERILSQENNFLLMWSYGGSLLLICIVFVAPIVEEIFFRGFVLSSFLEFFGPIIAIPLVSAIWALTHFHIMAYDNALGLYGMYIVLGVILGLSRYMTGSIYPPIFLHMLYNFVGVASGL